MKSYLYPFARSMCNGSKLLNAFGREGFGGGEGREGLESVVVGTIGKRTLICTVRWRAGMRRIWNEGKEGTCVRRGVVLFSLLCVFFFVVSLAHRRSLPPLPPPPPLLLVVDFSCYHFNFFFTILLVCFFFFPSVCRFFSLSSAVFGAGSILAVEEGGEAFFFVCVCVFFLSIIAMPTEVSTYRCLLF